MQYNNGGADQINDLFYEKINELYQMYFDVIKSRN